MQKQPKLETTLQYAYILSIALSPLGPVVHYSLWGICVLLLFACLFINKTPLLSRDMPADGKRIFMVFSALAVWVLIASCFTFTDVHGWGKNVTVILEVWLGIYLAARTLSTTEALTKFIKIFVYASALILIGNILRMANIIPFFPNKSLQQSNSIGGIAMLLFPFMALYALWALKSNKAHKTLLVLIPSAAIVMSFSAGAWMGSFFGGFVILWYSVRYHKLYLKFVISMLVLIVTVCFVANYTTHGKFKEDLIRELTQITSIEDANRLTTGRDKVWRASRYMIAQRPITGYAGVKYENKYRQIYAKHKKHLMLGGMKSIDHPHSTYFYLGYLGGIPAIFLFLSAMLLIVKKACKLAKEERNALFPWGISILTLIFIILVYGTNGDVFQGRRDISVSIWCIFGIICAL